MAEIFKPYNVSKIIYRTPIASLRGLVM